jgi:CheY-like chemotaxis protein
MDRYRKLKLLVVDGDMNRRYLLQSGVHRINPFICVDTVESVAEAKSYLTAHRYDVVFSAWLLPDEGGAALLAWMRAAPDYRQVPFVVIAEDGESGLARYAPHIVDDCVTAPFEPLPVYQKLIAVFEAAARTEEVGETE